MRHIKLAAVWLFLVLAFSLHAQQEKPDPIGCDPTWNKDGEPVCYQSGKITSGPTVTTLNAPVWTGSSSANEEIVHCDKTLDSGKPYKCHLVGKHTIDEVMQWIWEDGENRRMIEIARNAELNRRLDEILNELKGKSTPPANQLRYVP